MLKQRIITACILFLILLVAVLGFSVFAFQLFVGLVLVLAAWEWSRLSGLLHLAGRVLYLAAFLALLYVIREYQESSTFIISIGILWWLVALTLIKLYPNLTNTWHRTPILLGMGFAVLLPAWLSLIYLRDSADFRQYVFLFFAMVAAADIGAYFSGKKFGKHKLSPTVSPNKTWEGFAGGVLACCVVLWLALPVIHQTSFELGFGVFAIATCGAALLAGYSVVGDLFESMMKRQADVKDSGTLLPGHGGVLDRIDSMTAALPLYTWALMWAGLI
ncbi:MAG: phosphatidate cytidylyltransferase [Pseudomonadota bacterium]